MENKYYTPTIEEFHVGFEYEIYIISHPRNGKASLWIPIKIQEEDDLITDHNTLSLQGNIDGKFCRVKHLDREDIESLGWKQEIKTRNDLYFFDRYFLNFKDEITITDSYVLGTKELFNGKIKNKSELKKLMNQIGIL